MLCRACGHRIADNAIVCYKCGTPTAIPDTPLAGKPPAPAAARWRVVTLVAVVVLIVAGVVVWLWFRSGTV